MRVRTQSSSRTVLSSLVMTAVLAAAWTGCTPEVKDLRRVGIEQFRNRQYVESMATLGEVLELSPNDAQGNYFMGLNYRALAARKFRDGDVPAACRQLDRATLYFTQAIKSWPNYMAAIASKNEALESRGKYEEALTLAEHVARNNRGTAAEHFIFLGNEYRERGHYDSALRAYKIALANDPTSAKAYAAMGKLYLRVGDRTLARDAFRRAYELDETDPQAAEALAQLGMEPIAYPAAHESPR